MTDLKAWVAEATGGTITRWDTLAGGASRATWAVDVDRDGDTRPLVVRADTGSGPFSGTPFTLSREADVYRALEGSRVPVPRLHARLRNDEALLLDRLPGSDDLSTVADERERASIVDDFMDILAALHSVDLDTVDLGALRRPTTGAEHATADLDVWEAIATKIGDRDPFVRFTLGWLRDRAPTDVDRTVLVWGDAGPGNFMHHQGAVSGLLDWELAHVGDPMDDVAFLYTRVHLLQQPFGDMPRNIRRYADAAALHVDVRRIMYYLVFVALRMILSCRLALRAGTRSAVYHVLPPILERTAVATMAELDGVELEAAQPVEPREPTGSTSVLDTVMHQFTNEMMPALSGTMLPREQLAYVALVAHLRAADTLGPSTVDAELEDAGRVLGTKPDTLGAALARLHDAADADRTHDLLRYLGRRADRAVALWVPAVGPMATAPFPEIVVA